MMQEHNRPTHVIINLNKGEMACLHCGETHPLHLPVSINMFAAMGEAFSKEHRRCKPTNGYACVHCMAFGHEPGDCPTTQYFGSYQKWLEGPDTGMSSRTLGAVLSGQGAFDKSYPLDPADFGRCHRLLQAIPGWRQRVGEMKGVTPEWTALAAHWDELEALYLEESPTGTCPKLYARMRELTP